MITVGWAVLFAVLVEQLDAVVGPDVISEVIKQFEYREGLLRRPIGRDLEGDGERQAFEILVMTWPCGVVVRVARRVPVLP